MKTKESMFSGFENRTNKLHFKHKGSKLQKGPESWHESEACRKFIKMWALGDFLLAVSSLSV